MTTEIKMRKTGPIYRPKGRAAEYSFLALNHYTGCAHQCKYCYLQTRYGAVWREPHPKKNILEKITRQVPDLVGTKERVLLSFSSDPYQPLERKLGLTRKILELLTKHGIPFQVLTKAGTLPRCDFDLYDSNDAFAITLTCWGGDLYEKWERHSSPPPFRAANLLQAYKLGIETWVSLEPVFDPQESLEIIRRTALYVDLYKIGKLNYLPNDIDWRAFAIQAIEICEDLSKPYFIKSDLARYIEDVPFTNTDNRKANWQAK